MRTEQSAVTQRLVGTHSALQEDARTRRVHRGEHGTAVSEQRGEKTRRRGAHEHVPVARALSERVLCEREGEVGRETRDRERHVSGGRESPEGEQ